MPLYDDDGNELSPDQALAYLDQQQQVPPQQQPNFRRALETRATTAEQKAQEAETRAAAAERKLAFAQAGVPLDHPMSEYLVTGYKGEATADAIKAEATRLGILTPEQQAPQAQTPVTPLNPTADQAAAFSQIAAASAGQTVPAGRNWDAEKAAAPNREALHNIVREQAQAEGRQTPVIVND